ncbi:MAG: DUF899 domain-containing protein [Alphaproteobacteria bacterium]|nr:DUF899 domain-containing protein [Alphaproteobacteria bacterium]HPF46327.1 DUF899 domain-containing protein [Emcibacteraceae bacterium]HRW28425.1 DUF899 domain-containing protein [Emcibacteraceae bacterium]
MEHIEVTKEEWLKAREAHLIEEKKLTRALDKLAAERRHLPWVKVTKKYSFESKDGKLSLEDLFEGRDQLIVYHHMLKPGDKSPCTGCGLAMDNMPNLAHINARNTTFCVVARAPINEIEAFKKRMDWKFPWVSTLDDFNPDFDVPQYFGLNVFIRHNGETFRTYFTKGRGMDTLGSTYALLDLTPYGRQEEWQNVPKGTPQTPTYGWCRLHDEY